MPLDQIPTHTPKPRRNVRETSGPRHLRGGSQVSKARPGAPIILSRRFSHRLYRPEVWLRKRTGLLASWATDQTGAFRAFNILTVFMGLR